MSPFWNLLVGYDTFERHRLVGTLIKKGGGGKIVDVGGSPGTLTRFAHAPVLVTNLGQGDILSSGLSLPFVDDAFDVVTSLDVLEHIPEKRRRLFILELVRVAKGEVILCTPYGSREHTDQEKEIYDLLAREGISNPMLEEHVRFGLPHPDHVKTYLPESVEFKVWFTGDYRFNNLLFKIDHWRGASFKLMKAFLSMILTMVGNIIIYPLYISKKPRWFSNRMTFLITKKPCSPA